MSSSYLGPGGPGDPHGPKGSGPRARLAGLGGVRPGEAEAVLLVLHGGRAHSTEPVRRGNLAALRMSAMARALRAQLPFPVAGLRYRYRGWNDAGGTRTPEPVHDAMAALEHIGQRLGPVPVILVGHSLGGRTAVRVAGYPTVSAVAALAPWLPEGEPDATLAGRTVLIAHGLRDRVTDIGLSTRFAHRAAAVADAVYLKTLDDGHAMLRAPGAWHQLVADFATQVALGPDHAHVDAELLGPQRPRSDSDPHVESE